MSATVTEAPVGAAIEVRPLTPVIGAEVSGVDLRKPLDEATVAQLQRAIDHWKVLFFRDQDITDEDFLRFGRYFGPLTPAHPIAKGLLEHPEIWERKADEYRERRSERGTPNAIAVWDNTATSHAGPIDYSHFDLPRTVRRITVAGDLPEGPDGFRSRPLSGELFGVIG